MKTLMNQQNTVIVVGAGMAGLGAAAGLARAGRHVIVLSADRKGASSPAAGGILDPFLEMSPGHPLFQISREAFFRYPEMIRRIEAETGKSAGYKKTGMLFIAMNHDHMKELEKRYAWQRKTGIPVRWRSRVEVLKKDPAVTSKLLAGLFYPTVARVHPGQLTAVLQAYAESLGAKFIRITGSPVILMKQKKVVGVKAGKKRFYAGAVINATGAWAGLGEIGPKLPVSPAKGQILLVRSKQKISTILHSLDGGYIVPWEAPRAKKGFQNYLLGSTVEHAGFNAKTTACGLEKVFKKNAVIMPGLTNSKRIDAWSGLRPFSKKRVPLIGPSKIKGLYHAAGYYRSGILIACYAGELLAKAIVSGKMPRRIKPFDPRKFSL